MSDLLAECSPWTDAVGNRYPPLQSQPSGGTIRSSPARASLIVASVFFSGIVAGAATGSSAAARANDPYAGLDLFARALTLVERDYVEAVNQESLVGSALDGLVTDLDRHSRWMPADEYARLRSETEGRYEGIGVEVRPSSTGVVVVRVLEGSPAERDGFMAGDLLLELDGSSLAGLSQKQITEQLKGPRGSQLTLKVQREGWSEPKTIETTRDRIETRAVLGERVGDIGYLRVVQFQAQVTNDFTEAWDQLSLPSPPSAMIIDLRDNPGGLLDQAVAMSDLFLNEGVIVSTKSRVDGEEFHEATAGGFDEDLPVYVLVNGMSASASEILAGALQDTGRAVLIGTHTYGKGSVQSVYENPDGSALKLTTGRYYTPSGEPVAAATGRSPDHVVEFPVPDAPEVTLRARLLELELEEAERSELIALLESLPATRSEKPAVPWHIEASARGEADPQLAFALDLAQP
ncbi:MAG: S41 family peptidase [Proteobacteria bacterium]|nr:S41 family peptidase [Pseudomonadota bacterium]